MFPLVNLCSFSHSYTHVLLILSQMVSNYKKYENKLNIKGFEYAIKVTDIYKFENQNGLYVNVFELDKENEVYVLRNSPNYKAYKTHIDLYFNKGVNNCYAYIKTFSS